jgi:hypothetical protein
MIEPQRPMRHPYLTNRPVSGTFVEQIPMRKKSLKLDALPSEAEVVTANFNEAPDTAAIRRNQSKNQLFKPSFL